MILTPGNRLTAALAAPMQNQWVKYSPEESAHFEAAYKTNPADRECLVPRRSSNHIDFVAMTQVGPVYFVPPVVLCSLFCSLSDYTSDDGMYCCRPVPME